MASIIGEPNREKMIFEQALDIESAEERLGYLKGACGEDAALLKRLEALLHADQTAESFLPDKLQSRATINLEIEKPGDRIGRYKLLQEIGEGGCGVVYMAEQSEPVRRRVALKVIKLGMDTKQVVARFEAERQALALMDHPNIAKVLDAGATEAGRPYFVMELVRGVKITEYCDEGRLSTNERLELFIQVCRAIQHAHQKGIIHRDIKPSNILVTINDGLAVPKVIDFGIAKATAGPLTDKTIFTAFEQFMGTPAYMSPEQAVMTSLDIDTRSDIYSLGVLLYELLTGNTPFDTQELMAAGLDELRRTIREKEPVRPSTRLSAMMEGELTTTAKRRQTDAPKLIHLMRGDLDWIVMKALEKDRGRRYDTVNGLAADVQRHLNNEPVIACPPTALYRFQKLVRRNKLAVTAVTAIVTALVLGIAVSTWQAVRATRFRQQSQDETKRAEIEAVANRQNLYAADMNLANQSLESHNLLRARELLEMHRPQRGKSRASPLWADLRGWEWRYLYGHCRSDEVATLGRFDSAVFTVSISPDGKWLAAACDDGTVRIWDLPKRELLPPFETFRPSRTSELGDRNHAAVFSPDSQTLAVGGLNKEIILWNVVAHKKVATLTGHQDAIDYLAFSPDGKLLASASLDGTARLWDVRATPRRELAKLEPGVEAVMCVAFSPDGKSLVTGGAQKPVKVWDISDPTAPRIIGSLNAAYIESLAFSPDGSRLAVCGSNENAVRLWEFPSLQELRPLRGHVGIHMWLAFSPDGRRLASAGGNFCLCVWDLADPGKTRMLKGHENEALSVAFAPDGETLVSSGMDGAVRLWDVSTNSNTGPDFRSESWIHAVGFSIDSKYVAVLTAPDHLILWDMATKREVAAQDFSNSYEGQIDFPPDGKTLCVSSGGKARWFELPSLRPLKEEPAERLIVAPDGTFAMLLRQGQVIRRDLSSGMEISLGANAIKPNHVALSPDGATLAIAGDGTLIALWNTRSPGSATILESHTQSSYGAAFSPDGKSLATASWDGTIGLYDVKTRRYVKFLRGHSGGAWEVAFSPDGRTLASSADDGTIKLWNLASKQEAATLHGHEGAVSAIAFSPDGKHLVSGGGWTVRLWGAPTYEEIAAAEKTKDHRR